LRFKGQISLLLHKKQHASISSYKDAETDIRKIVAESLDRGKIDVGIFIESTNTANKNKINHELAKSYYHELKQLNESWGEEVKDYLSLVLKMPEVLSQESEEISEAEKEFLIALVKSCCKNICDFRAQEGEALKQEFEKLDISEEKMRLGNHLDYFLETMVIERTGKKLGFIAQEIGREINTLGSKSNHAQMQKIVVDMKDSLEKIKEQVLNTL